jgi:hypothetical protein
MVTEVLLETALVVTLKVAPPRSQSPVPAPLPYYC